jgi:hypothetical protein
MTRKIEIAIAAIVCAACTTHVDVGPPDAGPRPDAARRDAGRDADPFIVRDGGSIDVERPWQIRSGSSDPRDCPGEVPEAMTGEPCIPDPTWYSCVGQNYTYCGPDEKLVVIDIDHDACFAPVPEPWSDCSAALADGRTGEDCTGTFRCIAPDEVEPCCAIVAECNPPELRGSFEYGDTLVRTRLCGRPCGMEPYPERPTRTGCPAVYVAGDVPVLNGDPCEGVWSCFAGTTALGIQYPPALFSEISVWCDGSFLRISGTSLSGDVFSGRPLEDECESEEP